MTGIDAFKTRGKANEGIRITLSQPDGTPTEHWLQVRSVWSDDYQAARSELIRQAIEDGKRIADADPGEVAELKHEADRRRRATLCASLIAGWSFSDMECTEEKVAEFLLEAPQILRHVEQIAEDDRRFFSNGSGSLSSGESLS
ncbi:hypothetical protein [Bowmanella yangjiangensis]|uniref:Phage tail assembly chaperone n=1 Tax=Bowmanella yangjiangensis TaxID=2811230 RepID=A0ABS3CYR2_9ALTE|nr:hypothetical protein [Bowmanella yangjiangensis]MBN7822261.1 hypothetical protein [Bowmanella yangjiangensis]